MNNYRLELEIKLIMQKKINRVRMVYILINKYQHSKIVPKPNKAESNRRDKFKCLFLK